METRGKWRMRLLRFHAPLAVLSGSLLVLFMTLPLFDPLSYAGMDMEGRSALPQAMPQGMEMGGTRPAEADTMAHEASQASSDHAARQAPSSGHGAGASAAPTDHPDQGTRPAGHGDAAGSTQPDAVTESRARSRFEQRVTVATGYVATVLLAITLLVGPANLVLRRRNPVSSYLRRDTGMWTAGFSVVHVFVGLQVHSGGVIAGYLGYFFQRDGAALLNSFGLANWIGLFATVIVVGLLTISSDLALRTLKAPRWKWLQRLNYVLFALVVAHAFFYGAFLRVSSPFTLLLILGVAAVLAGQVIGIWLWRQRHGARIRAAA
jgi:sulfoxide reductase heme-binding subunit YedZ